MVRNGWPAAVASGRQEEAPTMVQAQWYGGGVDVKRERKKSKMPTLLAGGTLIKIGQSGREASLWVTS